MAARRIVPPEPVHAALQPTRTAHDRHILPRAPIGAARGRSVLLVELHVVRYEQIELAVAVIVDESAAGPPADIGAGHSRGCRNVLKGSLPCVPVDHAV